MLNVLYLVHRLPYPPNKGDKVRSYNILKHLSGKHNVYLGTFVDDPEDEKYESIVRSLCQEAYFEKLNVRYARFRSLFGLLTSRALSLNYYDSKNFDAWVKSTVLNQGIDAVVIFSSVMAQFVSRELYTSMLVDFVDVDSKKWDEYADIKKFPMSWLYRRESRYLLKYEKLLALKSKHSFFVTEKERLLFSSLVPESNSKTSALNNGVDSDFFSPNCNYPYPFDPICSSSPVIVFTGAMDYWPNIDAVTWFVEHVLSGLAAKYPDIKFYIVGRNPTSSLLNLRSQSVFVTGTVDDVRPFLQHATLIVAPLRIARGIQNKILEAMSMAKVVVASDECVNAIAAIDGVDIFSGNTASDFIKKIDMILSGDIDAELIGSAARVNVLLNYSWTSHLKGMDKYLESNLVGEIV